MARFLYLNGKRMTKFDLGHLVDDIAPAWSSNAWLMEDVWTYREFVERLLNVSLACSVSRLVDKLRYYYAINDETPSRFFADLDVYLHQFNLE